MIPILLLSQDKELSRLLKASLKDSQVKVAHELSSTRAAADLIVQHPVGLVVLDFFLSDGSGLEALKALKRVNESGSFLLLNRVRTRTVIERAFRLGAQDVLPYPVSQAILRDTILHRLESQPLLENEESAESALKQPRKKEK